MATTKKTTAAKSTAAKKKTTKKKTTTKAKKLVTAGLGDHVELHYKGSFADGTQFDSSYDRGSTIAVQVGNGQLIKGFDTALIGMNPGQTKSITLSPEDAYGLTNPEAFSTVQRNQFPEDYMFVEGQPVQGATEDGRPIFATIASFSEAEVILDMNHPLAGKELNFDIELTNILSETDVKERMAAAEQVVAAAEQAPAE
jgi:peptidylprolyl isomerase